MGAAQEQRAAALFRRQGAAQDRPVAFEIMERLNALPTYADAGTPLTRVAIQHLGGHWHILDPLKRWRGWSWWYPTFEELMRRWHITLVEYHQDSATWYAERGGR
jgi:hypothetical protein